MIQIISKRKFRFQKPGVDLLSAAGAFGGKDQVKYEAAMFETNGTGDLQQAPDWIRAKLGPRPKQDARDSDVDINAQNLLTWERAEADGHLMEVQLKKNMEEVSVLEREAAARSTELAREIAEGTKDDTRSVVTVEQLQSMKKDELIEHAETNHNLKLSGNLTKDELVSAIQAVQQV
jgi:hypothetical protein